MTAAKQPATGSLRSLPLVVKLFFVLLTGLLIYLFFGVKTYPTYDTYYHLVWGSELASGSSPSLTVQWAPTPHPLKLLVATLLELLQIPDGDRVLLALTLISYLLLVFGVYRLAERVFDVATGLASALCTVISLSLLVFAMRGYVDIPFLALTIWAAVAIGRSAKPSTPLLFLFFAGLLRPEAWLFSLLYLAWLLVKRRETVSFQVAVLAVAAPLLWLLIDLLLTGNPLHSLTHTSGLADDLGRRRGIAAAPVAYVELIVGVLKAPIALISLVGLVAAIKFKGLRQVALPLALLLVGTLSFLLLGVGGLSLIARYLLLPATALCIFAGFALVGWLDVDTDKLPDGLRRLWPALTVGAVVLTAVFAVVKVQLLQSVSENWQFNSASHSDLREFVKDDQLERYRRCGVLTLPNHRLVPNVRWLLGLDKHQVLPRSLAGQGKGADIVPLSKFGVTRYGFADGIETLTFFPREGSQRVSRSELFALYGRCS